MMKRRKRKAAVKALEQAAKTLSGGILQNASDETSNGQDYELLARLWRTVQRRRFNHGRYR
jgi:hypothetical protein